MKKIISIILVLALCLSCCFALAACSDDSDTRKQSREESRSEEYRREAKAEVAKSSFSVVMETYNGFITIKGYGMTITDSTTIQDVMGFLEAEGQTVTVEHLNTTLTFLGACKATDTGYYVISDGVEWFDYYAA